MMNPESELDGWRSAWTADESSVAPDTSGIVAKHRRQERSLRIQYLGNLGTAAAMILFAAYILDRYFSTEMLVWAMVIWLTTILATAFHLWNWRGLWKTSGEAVADFADVYEQRCAATLRAVRFGYAFLAVQCTIVVPWITRDFVRGDFSAARYGLAMGFTIALVAAFILWFRSQSRSARRELEQIAEFRRAWEATRVN